MNEAYTAVQLLIPIIIMSDQGQQHATHSRCIACLQQLPEVAWKSRREHPVWEGIWVRGRKSVYRGVEWESGECMGLRII